MDEALIDPEASDWLAEDELTENLRLGVSEDGEEERALWAKYASEIEDDLPTDLLTEPFEDNGQASTDSCTPTTPDHQPTNASHVTISPWWASLSEQTQAQVKQPVIIITNDDFLGLCAELCDRLTDRRLAHEWYDHVETHYISGDYTSLSSVYDAIYAAVTNGTPPVFPNLPIPSPSNDDLPVIAEDSPFHNLVWAAHAVQTGHTGYQGQAWAWARKIEDEETREMALCMLRKTICTEQLLQLTLL